MLASLHQHSIDGVVLHLVLALHFENYLQVVDYALDEHEVLHFLIHHQEILELHLFLVVQILTHNLRLYYDLPVIQGRFEGL